MYGCILQKVFACIEYNATFNFPKSRKKWKKVSFLILFKDPIHTLSMVLNSFPLDSTVYINPISHISVLN